MGFIICSFFSKLASLMVTSIDLTLWTLVCPPLKSTIGWIAKYSGCYWKSNVYVDRNHPHLHGVVFRWIRRSWAPQRNRGLRSSESLCPGGVMRRMRIVTLERSKGTGIWRWTLENSNKKNVIWCYQICSAEMC